MLGKKPALRMFLSLVAVAFWSAPDLAAQSAHRGGLASNVVLPQCRTFAVGRPGSSPVAIADVKAGVVILEQVATTTLDIRLESSSGSREEAELLVPVPDGAVVRSFTFEGSGTEPSATLLPRAEARRLYDSIVARVRDPALLEFAGYRLVRSSVFPVEPRGTQRVRLTYEEVLTADGKRVDYVLPRSEALDYLVPWTVHGKIEGTRPISTVYSPSHGLESTRLGDGAFSIRTTASAANTPGAFRLSYLLGGDGISASLLAYPRPEMGGGYFLLLAGLPARPPRAGGKASPAIRREVTLVIDRSGSMSGEKIEQAREAARQVIGGLEDGEYFNIVVYNDTVELFSRVPLEKNAENAKRAYEFLGSVEARSGTNIHDALLEALGQKPGEETLPLVLFLTDGLPTVGETSEAAIRDVALKANPYGRRIFSFGVGFDVNTPLLQKIAAGTRAAATFVLPGEDVEVKVGSVFRKLSGPILAAPVLETFDRADGARADRAYELLPSLLPDLFEGDQLVALGKYRGDEPLAFRLSGNFLGEDRTFTFHFDLESATTRNAFVPRLWASRKIASLIEAIRALGAEEPSSALASAGPAAPGDPRLRELVDEVTRLSIEFGILTEYTSFLAREGTDLSRVDDVLAEATANFRSRAVECRTGAGSVNQEGNLGFQRQQSCLNGRNEWLNADLERVAIGGVQQVCDRTFYRRGRGWVDARLVQDVSAAPDRVVEFGSEEHREFARRMSAEGRQGVVALRGDILLALDGERVLLRAPAPELEDADGGGDEPQPAQPPESGR